MKQFSSVAQSWLTLCDPVDCSMPGFPVHHQLKLMSIELVMSSNHLIPCPLSSCLLSFPASGCFAMSQFFTSGGQSIGASASASVLLVNIQDWFPLALTGWISLQSKGLSRVFLQQQYAEPLLSVPQSCPCLSLHLEHCSTPSSPITPPAGGLTFPEKSSLICYLWVGSLSYDSKVSLMNPFGSAIDTNL